jgi:riboflavin kinase/FMN adenylyltransferase
MSRLVDLDAIEAVGPAALCMGVFDGVHLGHRALAARTVAAAGERLASVALVFDPPPIEIIRPEQRVPRLAPAAENLRRLAAIGISHPIGLRFTDAMRQLPPDAFLAALAPAVELRVLVLTPDSAFGRGRAGTPEAMRDLGAQVGFEVIVLESLVEVDGEVVSSSRARAAIAGGDIDLATRLLGARPSLNGHLQPDGVLRITYLPALPAAGRYAATVYPAANESREGRPVGVRVDDDGTVRLAGFTGGAPRGELRVELRERLQA